MRAVPRSLVGPVAALVVLATSVSAQNAADVVVSPSGPVRTLTEALRLTAPGARILLKAGVYREPTIVVALRMV